MNYLKILWQHLFQQKNTSSEHTEELAAFVTHFSAEPLSVEVFTELMKETAFQELSTEDGPLQFRFAAQDGELESTSEEFAFQAAELLLKFDVPDFPEEDLNLDENDMQGLARDFWEKHVFDENFLKDIPDFSAPEFQALPADTLIRDEKDEQNPR